MIDSLQTCATHLRVTSQQRGCVPPSLSKAVGIVAKNSISIAIARLATLVEETLWYGPPLQYAAVPS